MNLSIFLKTIFKHLMFLIKLILFTFIVVSYQNCSQIGFIKTSDEASFKTNNNANGYSGKPEGSYYRFTPGFTCENKPAPSSSLLIEPSFTQFVENKLLLCGAVQQNLDTKLIDYSVYQNEVIGYQDGIFEGVATTPTSIPANLVEVWCFDQNNEHGIETITHYDRTTKLAVNRIYYSELQSNGTYAKKIVSDFSVARVITAQTVQIKGANNFELIVHRDQPAAQLGLFNANFKAILNNQSYSQKITCRLGGSFDAKTWPALQVVDFNIQSWKFSPDFEYFAYTSATATGIANLYSAQSNGVNHKQVAPNMLSRGFGPGAEQGNYLFSPDSKKIIFSGDLRIANQVELFQANKDGSSLTQLGHSLSLPNQSTYNDFKITSNGNLLIFKDGSEQSTGSQQKWLKSISLDTDITLVHSVSPPLSLGLDLGIGQFDISTKQNKVAFLSGNIYPDLYVANLDGSNVKKITPPNVSTELTSALTGKWVLSKVGLVQFINNGQYVLTSAQSTKTFLYSQFYAIATDGTGSISLPAGWAPINSLSAGDLLVLQNLSDTSLKKLFNLKTGISIDLPSFLTTHSVYELQQIRFIDDSSLFFNQEANLLVGTILRPDRQMQTQSYDVNTGISSEVCAGLTADLIYTKELSTQNYLILAYRTASQMLEVYIKNISSPCIKANVALVTASDINAFFQIVLSNDQKKLLVVMGHLNFPTNSLITATKGNSPQQLLYIPLDGKASSIVNQSVFTSSHIYDAAFLNDSTGIIYFGDQITPGNNNAFLWKIPQP
mgnify:CR=1 FL=1